MRHLTIFAILFVAVSCGTLRTNPHPSIDPYIFEDLINSTIEAIRPSIPEPIEIPSLDLDFGNEADSLLQGEASISNFVLSGIQGFQFTALDFQIIGTTFNFTLNLPSLSLSTDYVLDTLLLGAINVTGDGSVNVQLEDAEIQGSAQVNLTGGVSVDNVRVQLHLGNATFDIEGLLNDDLVSQLVSDLLNDLVVTFIDENQVLVSEIVSPIVEAVINLILGAVLSPDPPTESTPELVREFIKAL